MVLKLIEIKGDKNMSNQIMPFSYENKEVRIVKDNEGNPWRVAKDVCEVLEHSNVSMAIEKLDDDERSKFNLGRQGEVNIISEPGLYKLIFQSRKEEAKKFTRWITHEVLPAIRKSGRYENDYVKKLDDKRRAMFSELNILKAEQRLENTIREEARKIETGKKKIEDLNHLPVLKQKVEEFLLDEDAVFETNCRRVLKFIRKKGGRVKRQVILNSRVRDNIDVYNAVLDFLVSKGSLALDKSHSHIPMWSYTLDDSVIWSNSVISPEIRISVKYGN
jgi:anti-repressor protein